MRRVILIVQALTILFPWPLRRIAYINLLGWEIDRTARIGLSLVVVERLHMASGSCIGGFNIIKNIRTMTLDREAHIGKFNLISGSHWTRLFPDSMRRPDFFLGEGAAITHEHRIDCSDEISIGAFSTIAGRGTQIWTHSINVAASRQTVGRVEVGRYALIGSRSIILQNSKIGDYSVVGAGAVITNGTEEYALSGGIPCRLIKKLDPGSLYFLRTRGAVD